jgi:antitoxin component of MazEF toxin-antitoxin module
MVELKVCKFGNSLGVVLPKEVISRLHTADGEALFLIEAPDGGYQLTPYDPSFEKRMAKAEDISFRSGSCPLFTGRDAGPQYD